MKLLKIFAALPGQVLVLVWCEKLKVCPMFTFVHIAALIRSILRFQFLL